MATIKQGKLVLGIVLLLVVNLVWVLSAEVTKYLFIDLNFKRPFFVTYVKSCLFSVFLLRYLMSGKKEEKNYNLLDEVTQSEDEGYENECLSLGEFEPVILPSDYSDYEGEPPISPDAAKKQRRVRFSLWREVRMLPERIAHEAKLARLPYRPPPVDCNCKMSPAMKYTVYFAPMWFVSSVTYLGALLFSSVSSVNMISASSSLFVLVIGAIFSPHSVDKFSFLKFGLVCLNLGGVAIVSQFSSVWLGTTLATVSALTYAIYLVIFSVMSRRNGSIDMNLLFGVIGIFSLLVCTPLMFLAHWTGLEPQLPLPDRREFTVVLLNGIIGSVLSDYLWLYATLLTNSLISSISLTLTIPLSMFADAFFRQQFPDPAQLLAAIPIMVSFIGASMMSHTLEEPQPAARSKAASSKRTGDVRFRNVKSSDESERLMDEENLEF